MHSMITGIDHIAIMVRDFDATVANYETIFGRAPNWRGFMPGGSTPGFSFPDMALDIIGTHGSGPEADASRAEIEKFGDAIWGLGFSVPDLDAATRLFERRGLDFLPRHTTRTKNADGHRARVGSRCHEAQKRQRRRAVSGREQTRRGQMAGGTRDGRGRRGSQQARSHRHQTRPMRNAQSRSMADGWGSICGSTARTSNGARGSCSFAAAAQSLRSAPA